MGETEIVKVDDIDVRLLADSDLTPPDQTIWRAPVGDALIMTAIGLFVAVPLCRAPLTAEKRCVNGTGVVQPRGRRYGANRGPNDLSSSLTGALLELATAHAENEIHRQTVLQIVLALTDNYGTASTQLSGLFDHGSTARTFSPQISLPIFAAGVHVASLDLAKLPRRRLQLSSQRSLYTAANSGGREAVAVAESGDPCKRRWAAAGVSTVRRMPARRGHHQAPARLPGRRELL